MESWQQVGLHARTAQAACSVGLHVGVSSIYTAAVWKHTACCSAQSLAFSSNSIAESG
jgi:hypothetical protein